MAMVIPCSTAETIGLDDFIEHVGTKVDLKDADSVASAAPMLAALANDRQLILPALHQQMKDHFANQRVPTTQVVVLARGVDFYVRADLWPGQAAADSPTYREQAVFYRYGCGQNFPSLSTGHFGPGLINDLYAYDPQAITGYAGEPVPLRFVERVRLTRDTAMLLLPRGEVVRRQPPESFSITIGLMIVHVSGDTHMVDIEAGTLREFAPETPSTRRTALLHLAGLIGDGNTEQYLDDLSKASPCDRTRLAAYEALATLAPERAVEAWQRAADDRAALIQRQARQQLAGRGQNH